MLDCLGAQCWCVVFEQHTPLFKQYARITAHQLAYMYTCSGVLRACAHAQYTIGSLALLYKAVKRASVCLSLSAH